MARFQEPDSDQSQIVVLNFDELFPPEHFVPRLLNTIRELDLSAFDGSYENDRTGRPALPPDRVLAVLIYSLLNGNISMRNLEREMRQKADLMYLSGGAVFDHSSLSRFRTRHADAIQSLFSQTVFLGIEGGFINLEHVAIDGTGIKASASRNAIGTREELERRYLAVQQACEKRHRQWMESEDESEESEQLERLEKLEQQEERLAKGFEFLKDKPSRKRVHLTDPDADWHRNGQKGLIVGYSAQNAVDTSSGMIVHQTVVTQQGDSRHAMEIVEAIEDLRAQAEIECRPKYLLDAGYSSEDNLRALSQYDLFMPDREKVHLERLGSEAATSEDMLRFEYQPEEDAFICPEGERLFFQKEQTFARNVPYRLYRRTGCRGCPLNDACTSPTRNQKVIAVAADQLSKSRVKYVEPFGGGGRTRSTGKPLTLEMRTKLSAPEGRATYRKRNIVEGVFAAMKHARGGDRFLRRTLERVAVEWAERCIAHNLARLLGYTRLDPLSPKLS
ncbi:MAG: transposase [bacterium]|nr:transposase [bacterium]